MYDNVLFQITSVGDDDNQLCSVAGCHLEMLLACGYTKPTATLTHKDIPGIIECVTLHTTILKVYICAMHTFKSCV